MCSLNILTFKPAPKRFTKFDYTNKDINWKQLRCELDSLNDPKLYVKNYINNQVELVKKKLIQIQDKFIPHNEIIIRDKDNPWFDKEMRNFSERKQTLQKV